MIAKREYANAFFSLAEEEGKCEKLLIDLRTIVKVVEQNAKYLDLLDTPSLPKEEKLSLIDEAFSSLDEYAVNLMKLLAEKRLSRLIPSILEEYEALYDEKFNILRVEAVSAVAMSEEQLSRLAKKLENENGKTVIITNTVNPEILGGLKLRYAGIQLDGSLKTRLDSIEASLKSIIV